MRHSSALLAAHLGFVLCDTSRDARGEGGGRAEEEEGRGDAIILMVDFVGTLANFLSHRPETIRVSLGFPKQQRTDCCFGSTNHLLFTLRLLGKRGIRPRTTVRTSTASTVSITVCFTVCNTVTKRKWFSRWTMRRRVWKWVNWTLNLHQIEIPMWSDW